MPVKDVNREEVLGNLHLTLWAWSGPWIGKGWERKIEHHGLVLESNTWKRQSQTQERGRQALSAACMWPPGTGLCGPYLSLVLSRSWSTPHILLISSRWTSVKLGLSIYITSKGIRKPVQHLSVTKSSYELSIATLKITPKLRSFKQPCYLPMMLCIRTWKMAPRANSW